MITAILPVKTKSERLPDKNLRLFNGIPMYEHKIQQLQDSHFDRIVVSSESKRVLKVAESYNCQPHLRDSNYSTHLIPMSRVFKYICSEVPGDDVAWINVNNPLVGLKEYEDALLCWKTTNRDCLLSVYNLQKYVFWKDVPLNWIPCQHPKSQDLDGLYAMSFAINIRNRKEVIESGTFVGKDPFLFGMDKYISTKVDYEEDLEFCELLWKRKS